VYILHPTYSFSQANTYDGGECNNSSLVLKVQYGHNGILFSGDLERLGERPVLNYASILESEILKVSHHGSNTSSSYELLDLVQPILSVISVAQKNKFKHPSPKTLARLSHYCARNFLTSRTGAVVFEVSETEIKKVNWRNE
jgi:competence protein ComEC